MNARQLFIGSCVALTATAMSFAIRGDILGDIQVAFSLTKTQVGWISGAAFWGFGISIFLGGALCDYLGIRRLLQLAALGHLAGICLTVFAGNFQSLFVATLLIGVANGLVEAAVNPLVTTLNPEKATARLVALHAWFPGGIVIGGVLAFLLTQIGVGWRMKMLLMLGPVLAYAALIWGQHFPQTNRRATETADSIHVRRLFHPLFMLLLFCMVLTAATELGPGQWVSNIFNEMLASRGQAGVLLLVWINGIAYGVREFMGPRIQRVAPMLLVAATAPLAALGLWLFGHATSVPLALLAAALLAVGTAFWWPTMLGITALRFPNGGALALGIMGSIGSLSSALAGPVMGWINDTYGPSSVLPIWALLPVAIVAIFTGMLLHAHSRVGGGAKAALRAGS
jgi:fucose permease